MSNVITDKILYQIGNVDDQKVIFNKTGLTKNITTGVKNVYGSDNSYSHGSLDLVGDRAPKKQSYIMNVIAPEFYRSNFSSNYVWSTLFGKPKMVFFYDFEFDPTLPFLQQRNFGKFYYNPNIRCENTPSQSETGLNNQKKAQEEYNFSMRFNLPYFYDCSDAVECIDYETYINGLTYWDWGSLPNPTVLDWDDPANSWDSFSENYVFFKDLTNAQKIEFFTNPQPGNIKYFMVLKDRFFVRDTFQISRKYIINQTINSASSSDVVTTNDMAETSAECDVYRLELSEMATNQKVTIENLTNQSGISIQWVDSSNSPSLLVYNSYYKKLYSGATEIEVDSSKYIVTIPESSERRLVFKGTQDPFRIGLADLEQVRLTNSTGSNLDIKVDILLAYD